MAKGKKKAADNRISLDMTFEEAMQKALNTSLPKKKAPKERKPKSKPPHC